MIDELPSNNLNPEDIDKAAGAAKRQAILQFRKRINRHDIDGWLSQAISQVRRPQPASPQPVSVQPPACNRVEQESIEIAFTTPRNNKRKARSPAEVDFASQNRFELLLDSDDEFPAITPHKRTNKNKTPEPQTSQPEKLWVLRSWKIDLLEIEEPISIGPLHLTNGASARGTETLMNQTNTIRQTNPRSTSRATRRRGRSRSWDPKPRHWSFRILSWNMQKTYLKTLRCTSSRELRWFTSTASSDPWRRITTSHH